MRLSHFEAAAAEFLTIPLLRRWQRCPAEDLSLSLSGDNDRRWTLDDTALDRIQQRMDFMTQLTKLLKRNFKSPAVLVGFFNRF